MVQELVSLGIPGFSDLSSLTTIISLLILPFAHEDLAIVLGGYLIVNGSMPTALVGLCIYAGMIASDFALYGIGAGARHIPWIKRFAIDHRVRVFNDVLKRNIFGLVAVCRVVPGVVFVAFVACGWARVSLAKFSAASLIVSAFYTPLMLYIVIVFGDALDERIGLWAWPMLFLAITAVAMARKRVFDFSERGVAVEEPDGADAMPAVFEGMPPLSRGERRVALAERIPPALFYLPLVFNWLRLGLRHRSLTLPTAANPHIFTGGMWGESKSGYLDDVEPNQRQWIADFVTIRREKGADTLSRDCERAQAALNDAGIEFPIVAKPDIGWHGHGVRLIDDAEALVRYVAGFPEGETIILQRFVPYPAEAAILYARLPGDAAGRILSLTLRYFPHVIGNGRSTLRELIRGDARAGWKSGLHLGIDRSHLGTVDLACVPAAGEVVRIALIGNQRAGALYRDGRVHISDALERRIDEISRSMSEFHYGRFDLRFASVADLMRGENFSIVEVNGIGGEAIDAWDPRLPVGEAYRRLAEQQRLLFLIGERNRQRGFHPTGVGPFVTSLLRQGALIRRYPASA